MTARPADPEPGTVDPDAFVNAYVGVPFRWDGRDRRGVDCWGLAVLFYRDVLGVALPDWHKGDNGRDWINATIAAERSDNWRKLDEPRDGCLVLVAPGGRPGHIGIFHRGGVLHAQHARGVVWEARSRFALLFPSLEFGEYVAGGDRI
jgi:cell wall-associated NlpC family hydrolase